MGGNLQLSWLQDKNGLIWLGTNAGLSKYNPESEKIARVLKSSSFKSTSVNSITYSKSNDLLAIGTEEGIYIYNVNYTSDDFYVTDQKVFLEKNSINFTSADSRGNIWVGIKDGQVYVISSELSITKFNGTIRGIRGFYNDTTNNVNYIAGSEGLFVISTDNSIVKPEWTKDIKYSVAFLPNPKNVFVSHLDFIYSLNFNNKTLEILEPNESKFPSNMITNQYITDNTIWFSSISGGVFTFHQKNNKAARYHILNGKNVWSTYADSLKRFWSSTDAGIYIHDGKKILRLLTEEDGINYNDFKMTAHAQLKNGILIYGNNKGLSIINPYKISSDLVKQTPYISAVEINYKERPIASISSDFVLQPWENTITFKIGIADFLMADEATISYRFNKTNSEWSTFFPINYPISFNGLSPLKIST